eukprot:767687-Hanusia_phi.AAC.1
MATWNLESVGTKGYGGGGNYFCARAAKAFLKKKGEKEAENYDGPLPPFMLMLASDELEGVGVFKDPLYDTVYGQCTSSTRPVKTDSKDSVSSLFQPTELEQALAVARASCQVTSSCSSSSSCSFSRVFLMDLAQQSNGVHTKQNGHTNGQSRHRDPERNSLESVQVKRRGRGRRRRGGGQAGGSKEIQPRGTKGRVNTSRVLGQWGACGVRAAGSAERKGGRGQGGGGGDEGIGDGTEGGGRGGGQRGLGVCMGEGKGGGEDERKWERGGEKLRSAQVEYNGRRWSVERRYREFDLLDKELQRVWGREASVRLAEFPSKVWVGKMSRDVAQQRRTELELRGLSVLPSPPPSCRPSPPLSPSFSSPASAPSCAPSFSFSSSPSCALPPLPSFHSALEQVRESDELRAFLELPPRTDVRPMPTISRPRDAQRGQQRPLESPRQTREDRDFDE